jgi:hypothetical protein
MLTVLEPRTSPATDRAGALLEVRREDIAFEDIAPGRVAIRVTVRNEGDTASRPTRAEVSAAPLGAFLAWSRLATLAVPALEPGESTVLATEARRPPVPPVGEPSRLSPRRLLRAWAEADAPRHRTEPPANRTDPVLPADPLELIGHRNMHWAGNLDVFIRGGNEVERHFARSLRVYPGRINCTMFKVGTGRDAYRYEIHGADDWQAALYDLALSHSLRPGDQGRLPPGAWHEVRSTSLLILGMVPPSGCAARTVEVRVQQRSSGKVAVVEFGLDPSAVGPGCFLGV